MNAQKILRVLFLTAALAGVSACDTAEERAEKHFQKGLELLESGDVDRALVELRNVFDLNGQHREARLTYAATVLEQGDIREAFGQYLRLVEQYPDNLEGRRALAELGIKVQNWEEAERHGKKAMELAPDDPRVKAIGVALEYRKAIADEDTAARDKALKQAMELQGAIPDSEINQSLIIDGLVRENDFDRAMAEVDTALASRPDDMQLYRLRLRLLGELKDDDGIEAQLRDMMVRFPDDAVTKNTLIRFYMSRKDLDSAEQLLRGQIVPGEANDNARLTLVQFLTNARGSDVALKELESIIAEGTNNDRFRSLRAAINFTDGKQEEAIAELDDILKNAEESNQTRDIKIVQARFLVSTGNDVGARKLVEEILAEDPSMVEALKLRAAWLIDGDQSDEAVNVLRTALDQNPNDADIMTLMARAHQRNGSHELAGELLSLAVEASNSAAEESIRYARYLIGDEKLLPAESVLVRSLRLSPDNIEVLSELGTLYVRLEDWPRAQQVEATLRKIDSDEAAVEADRLKVLVLGGQSRGEDAIEFLEALADDSDSALAAQVSVVRAQLMRGDVGAARTYLNDLLRKNPDTQVFQFLDAAIMTVEGNVDGSRAKYREILERDNQLERIWLELIRTYSRGGEVDTAKAVLDEALTAMPSGRDLLWMKASFLGNENDNEGAIAIYEKLYAENSSTSIVANNLASLLASERDDAESLDRAYQIARRLRGSEFAPFQDTYGWIAYRRGDYEEALSHLEPAAAGMATDALVQFHLGMAYAAAGRTADAIAQLEKTVEMAGDDPRPQFEIARQELQKLKQGE